MTMRVVFIRDTLDYKAGWEGFISRALGRTLCHQNITIPHFGKEKDDRYIEFLKGKRKAEREKKEPEKEKSVIKPKKGKQTKAVSVKAETREMAVNT